MPLWLLSLGLVMLTAALWWRDMRHSLPARACRKRGYDLTGNVSGVCPERGKRIEPMKDDQNAEAQSEFRE